MAARAPNENQNRAHLDRYVEAARADWRNVGVALVVVQGDAVVYLKGFGLRQIGKPETVDADTLFQIGSTSKAIAAAALGVLVDADKVRWDDPVVDYWPQLQLGDPWLTRNITVRDTVTHRSGIQESPYFVFSVMSAEQAMRQLRYITPEAAFRDSYRYSNLLYGVAGEVAAAVSGMSWNEFVKQRLLQPLQMKRSGASPYEFWDARFVTPTFQGSAAEGRPNSSDARDANVAMPHVLDANGTATVLAWQSYDNAAAAGSIVSCASDMANWLRMNLNEGRLGERQILSTATVRELHATQNLRTDESRDQFPLEGPAEGYAMGWIRSHYQGQLHLAHSGGILGFPAYVALLPERRIGVAVLSNSPNLIGDSQAFNKAIAFRALDQQLGGPLRDWSQAFLAKSQSAHEAARSSEEKMQQSRLLNAPPSLPLDQYVGDYEDRQLHSGPISIRLENGRLALRFAGAGAFSGVLEPWHHDVFRLHPANRAGPGGYPSFGLDASGKVTSFVAFNATFERLPAKQLP
ncbi:MAG: serine hydrolase [Steroidobacter sp.]|nr:serine hydrolase [Steroidobacter sp.]